MKELVLKKRSELEEICRKTHMVPEPDNAMEYVIEAMESGEVDPASVLEQIELQIAKVKEEALSRKEILEKVEKWLGACEEESWLEEYNRDENRYNAGKGAHLTLKRAEKARSLVNKLPGMVDALASKTISWEKETGIEFFYDGIRLLSMLEEYTILRQEKEQERRRQRDQKKLQGQLIAEQEALYGSKPSPSKPQCGKKGPRVSTGGASNRRVSLGGNTIQTPKPDSFNPGKATPRPSKKTDQLLQNDTSSHRQDDSFAAFSTGRRGLDIASLPVKKQSFGASNVCELESPMIRKPFSSISTVISSKANMADSNTTQSDMLQKGVPVSELGFATPVKTTTTTLADEENRTPKTMPISMPATPATVSVAMQMAITPAPPPPPPIPYGPSPVEDPEEIEYSFEERRLGFVLPGTHVKPILQV